MEPRFASDYEEYERWHWWFRARQRILESVLRRELGGRLGVGSRLISVGCGPPKGLDWLIPFAGPRGMVMGMDADQTGMLRKSYGNRPLSAGVNFAVGTLENPPIRDGSFDAALLLDILEHLEDDVGAIANVHRFLKPGGLLLITVPALPSLWGNQDRVSHHMRRYTARSLREMLRRAGIPRPNVTYFNSLLFPPIAAVRWFRRLTHPANETRSDFERMRPGLLNSALETLFGFERHLVGRVPLPIGVSLLVTTRV